jgi:hypothetical protein
VGLNGAPQLDVANCDFKLESSLGLVWAVGLLAVCAGCATAPPEPALRVEPAPPPPFDASVELPAGRGREILVATCLGCHDLTALPLFKPFYTRDAWRTLVVTMQEHGAHVDGAEIEVLADYLAQHFGTKAL